MDKDIFKLLLDDPPEGMKQIEVLFGKKIIKRVSQFIKNNELLKDVIQNVYVDIFLYREKIVTNNNPLGYILKMARNHAIKALKKEHITLKAPLKELKYHTADNEVDKSLMRSEKLEQVLLKAEELTEKERNLMHCVVKEGLNNKEIEEKLGLTAQDVRNVKYIAFKKLRRHFDALSKD
ncbi:RNA polymerase sigma factor [Sphingobacterium yanglingense]|uniref:RNA polymerase sigma factor (Sigma-70 family) n=1 Tax=Sphingobacterium yanglingense TaxID=1437280 RepID=A0A4R6WH23_9SPHI|nr:sigma-70 family RNA polymerase sigma factor [Sphingobacterium yanglingense]TDQ79463.1 RNA polymerase sigma factor (sigma-70 family) [Sphingobacterium yanglingense]